MTDLSDTTTTNGHRPATPFLGSVPFSDLLGAPRAGNGQTNVYDIAPPGKTRQPGTGLLVIASVLILALAAGMGYVSWFQQFVFIDLAKHAALPSQIQATGLDVGAVSFALLGLAHARMGRPAVIERALNLGCAAGSAVMNLLGAHLGSPRSVAVFIMPALLYAAASDRLIAVVAHRAGVESRSPFRPLGTGLLYVLRFALAARSTWFGLRRMVLAAAPVPGKELARDGRRAGESKAAALRRMYATHPACGDRAQVSRVATELAPRAGYADAGPARTELYRVCDEVVTS